MGPTVPFVLGALRQPIGSAPVDENEGRKALTDLLSELRAAPPRRGVRIQWCTNIKAYVATSMPFVDGLAWDVTECKPDDFQRLVNRLWDLYGASIMAGQFSIDDYAWRSLTRDEIETIEQLRHGEALSD
jgi:hypothetical protein